MTFQIHKRWLLSRDPDLRRLARRHYQHVLFHPDVLTLVCTPCRARAGLPPVNRKQPQP